MQTNPSNHFQRRGGRTSSPKHRQAQAFCEDFAGLPEGVRRYDLLLLVKRTGKAAGFTSSMIDLLEYYMHFTRDADWEEGSRPIVYQSQTRTALDLGKCERQVQELEKQLFERGAITWNDSGNLRRFGLRDEQTGKLLYAYGVDLTPLAYLREELQDKLHEKQLHEKAWMETKRQISWYRSQIRSLLNEASEQADEGRGLDDTALLAEHQARAEALARPIRTYMTLEALRTLLHEHKALHADLKALLTRDAPEEMTRPVSQNTSPSDDQKFAHKETTSQYKSNKLENSNADLHLDLPVRQPQKPQQKGDTVGAASSAKAERGRGGQGRAGFDDMPAGQKPVPAAPPSTSDESVQGAKRSCGLEHLTWKQIMLAASDRFRDRLVIGMAGLQRPLLAGDCVRAAYDLTGSLGISHDVWAEACAALGEKAAAVCVILIDNAMHRPDNTVRKPNGYFRGMIRKSQTGELYLHKSIFGLLHACKVTNHA